MDMTTQLLPPQLLWPAALLALLLLLLALWQAPWRLMLSDHKLNIFLGSVVFLLLLWQLRAGLQPGLSFHLLGATLFTLMFGWQLALIGIALVVAISTHYGIGDWPALGINILLLAALPVAVTHQLLQLSLQRLRRTFFIYVLVNGYLGGALAMLLTQLAGTLLLLQFSDYSSGYLQRNYLPFAPMMIFAEAFLSGMLSASLVLWKPEWIRTFDDRRYLNGK